MKLGKKEEADKSLLYKKKTFKPKSEFYGKVPNLLIGTHNYPFVNVGSLVSENFSDQDNIKDFIKNKLSINKVLEKRQELVNTKNRMHVKGEVTRYGKQVQELAKSTNAVSSEVHTEKPILQMQLDHTNTPHGPSAQLKKLDITENTKIPKRIDQISEDNITASNALEELQQKKYDEYYLTKLLSVGTLGKQQNKKIVPTKWSITAVDDHLGKNITQGVLDQTEHNFELFTGNYFGNYYWIIVQPGRFAYELIEYVLPKTINNSDSEIVVAHDYEFEQGRKSYASSTTGGYYAARLPVLEYLKQHKRQGRVTVYRIITPEYTVPLGVWVVREGIRQTLNNHSSSGFRKGQYQSLTEIKKQMAQEITPWVHNTEEFFKISKLFGISQTSLGRWF
jgi:hypothetical protein